MTPLFLNWCWCSDLDQFADSLQHVLSALAAFLAATDVAVWPQSILLFLTVCSFISHMNPPLRQPPAWPIHSSILSTAADGCIAPLGQVEARWYDGETHTSPLIENPMRGKDKLTDDILAWVTQNPSLHTDQFPLCPPFLIALASMVCPF